MILTILNLLFITILLDHLKFIFIGIVNISKNNKEDNIDNIYRSGRTARQGQQGLSLSLVAPQDSSHHSNITAVCAPQVIYLNNYLFYFRDHLTFHSIKLNCTYYLKLTKEFI